MSASLVRTSIILPFPSSPHWAPTRIVLAISYWYLDNKNPRIAKLGAYTLFCVQTLERVLSSVNVRVTNYCARRRFRRNSTGVSQGPHSAAVGSTAFDYADCTNGSRGAPGRRLRFAAFAAEFEAYGI